MKIEIFIASPSDYERCVCEVWLDDELWCVLSEEAGDPDVEFYPRDGQPWKLPYAESVAVLAKARARLLCEPVEPGEWVIPSLAGRPASTRRGMGR